jgi:putative lipoic acid-binding regulatory protein
MIKMGENKNFYKKLQKTLDDTTTFPAKYLYKFIIPADKEKLKKIENIFNYGGAVINTKPSKTGKYTSISIHMNMNSSDEIISKYEEVGKINGVISL